MLIGNVIHGVDAKGRVFIPAKWREELGSVVVVTHGFHGNDDVRCLAGMSEQSFRQYISRFSALPETDILLQKFRRLMLFNSTECEMDKQGRILIPTKFREYASLDKEVVLVGMDDRIEIWNEEALNTHNNDIEQNYNEALLALASRGI